MNKTTEALKLADSDGENKAIRCFLMMYGTPGLTVGAMQTHLVRCGYPLWPAWVDSTHQDEHLTKAGAQQWIRYFLAEQEKQEPVVYRVWHRMGGISYRSTKPSETEYVEWDALYAAPVQQVDLTVSDLDAIIEKHYDDEMDLKAMILDGIAAFKEKNK